MRTPPYLLGVVTLLQEKDRPHPKNVLYNNAHTELLLNTE